MKFEFLVAGGGAYDQGGDGQEVRSVVARRGGRGLRLRDLVRVQEPPLHVLRRQRRHLYMEVFITDQYYHSFRPKHFSS